MPRVISWALSSRTCSAFKRALKARNGRERERDTRRSVRSASLRFLCPLCPLAPGSPNRPHCLRDCPRPFEVAISRESKPAIKPHVGPRALLEYSPTAFCAPPPEIKNNQNQNGPSCATTLSTLLRAAAVDAIYNSCTHTDGVRGAFKRSAPRCYRPPAHQ